MHQRLLIMAVCAALIPAVAVYAVAPPMPLNTNGDGNAANNGMKHANVSLTGTVVGVLVGDPPPTPVTMTTVGFGVDFTPSKFDVLENVFFNAQYGWLPDGFFSSLPAGGSIWIKRTAATQPAGSTFKVYEGGNGAEGMAAWSMNEIYATNGDLWQWDGVMQHDYYTANAIGNYSMTFEIYVGDAIGDAVAGFTPASTTFNFTVVPEPSTCVLALLGAIGLLARRR